MTLVVYLLLRYGGNCADQFKASEALRARKRKRKIKALELDEFRRLIQEDILIGPSVEADLVFSRLRAKYAAMPNQEEGKA